MPTYRTPKPLNVDTSIFRNGKWRLLTVRGEYVSSDEPELKIATLCATGRDIKAELTADERAAIIKELIAAAKRDERGLPCRQPR